MRKYNIRGVKYLVKKARIKDRGVCDSPKAEAPTIKYSNTLKGEELLEVLIHEVLHACLWDLDEHAIDESAVIISKVLLDHFKIETKPQRRPKC
jgi:hypothetical protein